MKSFTSFVAQTKRQNMVHLQQMKPLEFLKWAKSVKSNFHGKLSNVPISLKVDGLGFRYGKSMDGTPFVESSRSGPISKLGSFSEYTRSKTSDPVSIQRSAHYDDILELFLKSNFIRSLPRNSKVICEVLYNPMAELVDTGLKFVSITYDKKYLGKTMTIVIFDVVSADTGLSSPDAKRIIQDQLHYSNDNVKIVTPELNPISLDISANLMGIDLLDGKAEYVLQSRKQIDKELKNRIIQSLDVMKSDIADYILTHKDLDWKILGDEMEGVVLDLNGQKVKITTDKFKEQKRAERK